MISDQESDLNEDTQTSEENNNDASSKEIFIYKSFSKIMPEIKFINFNENLSINTDLDIQKISQNSFLDFEDNESESFQDLFRFINFFVEQENFQKNTIQIGPVFYIKNFEDSSFINELEDISREEKEIIFYMLDCDNTPSIEYMGMSFDLEKNYAVALKYQFQNQINLTNFKNAKFICAWKRYA